MAGVKLTKAQASLLRAAGSGHLVVSFGGQYDQHYTLPDPTAWPLEAEEVRFATLDAIRPMLERGRLVADSVRILKPNATGRAWLAEHDGGS